MGSQGFVHCIGTSYGKISFILLWYFSYFKTLISALNLMFDLCLFIAYLSPSLFAEFCRLHCTTTSTAAAAELKTSSDAQTFVDLLLSKRAHLWNATSKVAPSRKCHKHTLASNQGRQMFSFNIFPRSVCIGQMVDPISHLKTLSWSCFCFQNSWNFSQSSCNSFVQLSPFPFRNFNTSIHPNGLDV